MDFVVLAAVPLIIFFFVIGLVFIICRKLWLGLTFVVLSVAYNIYTESIPVNLSFTKEEKGRLKVLSYNIYSSSDYYVSVKDNPREMAELILGQDADIVVLVEYYPDKCEALRDSLLKVYPYLEYQTFHCSNAIFSKYPLSDFVEMELEFDSIDEYMMRLAKDYDFLRQMASYRNVTSVTVTLPDDSLHLIACHLASNHYDQMRDSLDSSLSMREKLKIYAKCLQAGRLEREVEVKYIMKDVRSQVDRGEKVIVVGDMNDVAGSQTLRDLRRRDVLRNGWWERGLGLGLTFHNHKVMHFRLDHFLHSRNIRLKTIKVIESDCSDHLPIVAEIDF